MFSGNRACRTLLSAVICLSAPVWVHARIIKITIVSRASAFDGQAMGPYGVYEKVKGIAAGELDPKDRRNAGITDIELAPRNANGRVQYRANFTLVKPIDTAKAPGVLLYNVVNRGGHGGPGQFHIGGDPGDGFLYKRGHSVLWSGWQGDIALTTGTDREGIELPVARYADGSPVTGPVWERFQNATGHTQALSGTVGRTPASLDTAKAKLISIASETPAGVKSGVKAIAASEWAFADCRTLPFPGTPDPTRVCLKPGFDPALLYELVYTARDPIVMGAGMAAMRDVISFFRYEAKDDAGTANPLAGAAQHVICTGSSQSGRLAKTFLNLGFNEDESSRRVCDGMNPQIAGMLGGFNIRFAKPGDIAEVYDPGADGPLWWGDYVDQARGRPAWGLLHRCQATSTCPKIFESYGGPEFWYSRGTVGITGTAATGDLPLPPNVRRYYHPGTPHGGGRGGFSVETRPVEGAPMAANPNPERETDRALYVALVDWVVKDTAPPPSAYPRVSDGTLVGATAAAMGWPKIPGAPTPDGVVNPVLDYDYGPGFRYNDESGVVSNVPPKILRAIPTLVPKVDADGNERGGVPSLLHRVPLGTYTGWNPMVAGALSGREKSLAGGFIPFAKTKAERVAKNDPRLSLAERYGSVSAYYAAAVEQAAGMVKQRFLLPEDAIRLLQQMMTELEAGKVLER